jgi:uncharacterized protein YifN (PemK superfamily)
MDSKQYLKSNSVGNVNYYGDQGMIWVKLTPLQQVENLRLKQYHLK